MGGVLPEEKQGVQHELHKLVPRDKQMCYNLEPYMRNIVDVKGLEVHIQNMKQTTKETDTRERQAKHQIREAIV
jgi:hypothetical protein